MSIADAPTIIEPDVGTDEAIEELEKPDETPDDPNMHVHVVRAYENGHLYMKGDTAKEIVARARWLQVEVIALCGHRWVPRRAGTETDKYSACNPCIKIAGEILNNPHSHD